jgi:hypothetical protein
MPREIKKTSKPQSQPQPQKQLQPQKGKAAFEIEYEVIKDEEYYSCYIPDADIHFSVPIKSASKLSVQDRIKHRVITLTKAWMDFWKRNNKKGNIKMKREKAKPEGIVIGVSKESEKDKQRKNSKK